MRRRAGRTGVRPTGGNRSTMTSSQRLEALAHVLQRVADEGIVLGQPGKQLHRDLGDVAKGAFVADHDVTDIRADRAARHVLDPGHGAVREDGFQPDDHVLDAAVERRELADAARRDQAAHLRDRLRLG